MTAVGCPCVYVYNWPLPREPALGSDLVREQLFHSRADLRSMPPAWPRPQRESRDNPQPQRWSSYCLPHSTLSCSMSGHGWALIRQTERQGRQTDPGMSRQSRLFLWCDGLMCLTLYTYSKKSPVNISISSFPNMVCLAGQVNFSNQAFKVLYKRH